MGKSPFTLQDLNINFSSFQSLFGMKTEKKNWGYIVKENATRVSS